MCANHLPANTTNVCLKCQRGVDFGNPSRQQVRLLSVVVSMHKCDLPVEHRTNMMQELRVPQAKIPKVQHASIPRHNPVPFCDHVLGHEVRIRSPGNTHGLVLHNLLVIEVRVRNNEIKWQKRLVDCDCHAANPLQVVSSTAQGLCQPHHHRLLGRAYRRLPISRFLEVRRKNYQ